MQHQRMPGVDWVGGIEDLKEFLSRSDFVILCLPMTFESRNLIDQDAFSSMKRGAFLINLSRGGIVDRDALQDALASGSGCRPGCLLGGASGSQ
jgi:phosphoglycerate dehydrogenase-like enzyme